MKLLVSHPTLNEFSKNLVIGLSKNKLLFKLFTAIAIFPNQLLIICGFFGIEITEFI